MIDKSFVSELNKLDVLVEYTVKQFKPKIGDIMEEEVYKIRDTDFSDILTLTVSKDDAWVFMDPDIAKCGLKQVMKILEVVEKKIESYKA